jgi:hypothetical protein
VPQRRSLTSESDLGLGIARDSRYRGGMYLVEGKKEHWVDR